MIDDAGAPARGDARIQALLLEYVRLTDGLCDPVAQGIWCLTAGGGGQTLLRGRNSALLAMSAAALEHAPDAEIAVAGSPFVERLIDAVRARGHRLYRGRLPAVTTDDVTELASGTGGVRASLTGREMSWHRVVRLTVRVTLAAGAGITEHIVDSDLLDAASGAIVPDDVTAACARLAQPARADTESCSHVDETFLTRFLPGIEARLATEIDALEARAARELAHELQRIDDYYDALVAHAQETGTAARTIDTMERDRLRRRSEEQRRHEVRTEVHPLQLVEWDVPVEQAVWHLQTPAGRSADVVATRWLVAAPAWRVACPQCGRAAAAISVCRAGHAVCGACASVCTVCRERFCATHGGGTCHIDGAAACSEHGCVCPTCDRTFCSRHAARCVTGDHEACEQCVAPCASCARPVCSSHGIRTGEAAPLGARWLCSGCAVFCEGRRSEPVGRDEAQPCVTCGRWICASHTARCAVDDRVHCSTHLRPSDRSGRLLCADHAATCAHEPGSVIAQDEARPCTDCGAQVCDAHGAPCCSDARWHCSEHIAPLADRAGDFACAQHRTHCHIDGRASSPEGASPCAACGKNACAQHSTACPWCGGTVCVQDWNGKQSRCTTCRALSDSFDLPDAVLSAAARRLDGRRVKAWRAAQDAQRTVIETSLGWTRRMVLTVPHGAAEATRVRRHSWLGSREG